MRFFQQKKNEKHFLEKLKRVFKNVLGGKKKTEKSTQTNMYNLILFTNEYQVVNFNIFYNKNIKLFTMVST